LSNVFEKFYDSIFDVLSNDVTLTGLVPVGNIQPSHDPSEQDGGASIIYGWQSSQWDSKANRGVGTLYVKVSSPENKVKAQEIFGLLRGLLTARSLTDGVIRVHLFREDAQTSDMFGVDERGKYVVSSQFLVKLVEV